MFAIDLILDHLPVQRIAMNTERLTGLGLIVFVFRQGLSSRSCLFTEDLNSLFQKEASGHQMVDQSFKTFFHSFAYSLFLTRWRQAWRVYGFLPLR